MSRMAELLERINYDAPGLEEAKTLYEAGNLEGTMDAIVQHFRTRTSPKYLFEAKELEACTDGGILQDAQDTMNHTIYGHTFDGEIDWFFNPTEFTSHDNEWTWSLYRHIYWQPLARAYALTKDEKYTREFLHQMESWAKAWPVGPFMENEEDAAAKYKFPGHSWRTIETAMRIYTVWLPCMEVFRSSPAWDREGWVTFLSLLCDHADFLMTHYSNHKKSSNWLTMESGTLLQCGILFPEIKSDWFMTGYRRVMQEVKYSFDNDGIHMERTPIYHMVAAGVYFQCYRLCHKPIPAEGRTQIFPAGRCRQFAQRAQQLLLLVPVFLCIAFCQHTDLFVHVSTLLFSIIPQKSGYCGPVLPAASAFLFQILAVGRDAPVVPVERILFAACQRTVPGIVLIHIDHAIALAHFHGPAGYQVDESPHGVSDQLHAVLYGLLHLPDMGFQVVDAVGIMNGTVRFHHILGAQAVLRNEDGQLVSVVHLIQCDPQAHRIFLPSPLAGFQIRVFVGHDQVAAGLFPSLLGGGYLREVVGERHKVDGVFPQEFRIARLHIDVNSLRFKVAFHVGGVLAAGHHIQVKPVGILIIQNHLHHVVRLAGGRIGGEPGNHAPDLAARPAFI